MREGGIIPPFAKKNAPAQSYLSGGAIVPKETQGGNWIFASTRQARVQMLWLQTELDLSNSKLDKSNLKNKGKFRLFS